MASGFNNRTFTYGNWKSGWNIFDASGNRIEGKDFKNPESTYGNSDIDAKLANVDQSFLDAIGLTSNNVDYKEGYSSPSTSYRFSHETLVDGRYVNVYEYVVQMPDRATFKSKEDYMYSKLHEEGHLRDAIENSRPRATMEDKIRSRLESERFAEEYARKKMKEFNVNFDLDNSDEYLKAIDEAERALQELKDKGIDIEKYADFIVDLAGKNDELNIFQNILDLVEAKEMLSLSDDELFDLFRELNNQINDPYRRQVSIGNFNDLFGDKFVNLVPYRDPLILDLNGNGKIDVTAEGSGVYFDFNKDGIASSTGWLSGGADGDGLLVFDKNFDGVINDGTELFGDDFVKANGKTAKNGFDALASLDSDKDGIISALDPMYHFLKVWKDTNGDGISQADELFSLAQLGIAGLVTGYQDKDETLEGGNMLTQEGVYINADGSFGVMGDVNFVQDFTNTEFVRKITMTDEQRNATGAQGMGRVRDLNEALTLSPLLQALFNVVKSMPTKAGQMFAMQKFLHAWAEADSTLVVIPKGEENDEVDYDVSAVSSSSSGTGSGSGTATGTVLDTEFSYFRKVFHDSSASTTIVIQGGGPVGISWPQYNIPEGTIERIEIINAFFNLEPRTFWFVGQKHLDEIVEGIDKTYASIELMAYQQLLPETRFAKYIDLIGFDLNTFTLDYSKVMEQFSAEFALDYGNTAVNLFEFLALGHNELWPEGVNVLAQQLQTLQAFGFYDGFRDLLVKSHAELYEVMGFGVILTSEQTIFHIKSETAGFVMGDVNFVQDFTQMRSSISA